MAMDPLALLGDYGSDDDSDSDAEQELATCTTEQESLPQLTNVTTLSGNVSSNAAALPDADSLLDDMPNWSASVDGHDSRAQIDKKGTRYNAVPMNAAMAKEADRANMFRGERKAVLTRTLIQPGGGSTQLAPVASTTSQSLPPNLAQPHAAARKQLLPPQLRRPNIPTEDLGGMGASRGAKRPKHAE
mmetsp:Transcript_68059/g.113172  ORF Transcript_68059/g.113172 Transcript_68059/m.113172 type:complete len:188 (+) Transcript_68059:89-652(+)|eukprot:CAMPEP_0119316120 /NCGR_PEP_ID=MMETSP1333-20130426/38670_1 /TAXON_ID=418940 /ORGANISM="Scyphosphaera apsteinii, Strain RCC1455" /LENGTH=187 /DNA_ID=CAMNT_0007321693 /DNA_START=75 /DNA_END=638 /DNA_ORIENTATION=+